MKALNYFDQQIAESLKDLYQKVYWLTGKDNFWLALVLGLISVLITFGSSIYFLSVFSPNNIGILNSLHGLSTGGMFWFGFFNFYAVLVLRQDAKRNNSREIRAIDHEADRCKEFYKAIRILFLVVWPAVIAFAVYFTDRGQATVLALGSMAVAYVLAGAAMYFATIENPPKKRFSIKQAIKFLFSKLLPKERLMPVPVPIPS